MARVAHVTAANTANYYIRQEYLKNPKQVCEYYLIALFRSVLTVTKAQPPSHYNVAKHRVCDFVGREDMLQRIDKALITSPGLSFAVLQGLGGQGKSQIALENCQKKESTPYSATFWVDASTSETVQGSFGAISEELKNPGKALPNIQQEAAKAYSQVGSMAYGSR